MKIYRNGIYISIYICVISILLMLLFHFVFNLFVVKLMFNNLNNIESVLYDILLGIFCSSFVVMITNIGSYKIEKSKSIGYINFYCTKYISELANLLPLLADFSSLGEMKVNLNKSVDIIKNNENVNSIVKKLIDINNERMLAFDGFYPFLKKNKKNLCVHHVVCMLYKINNVISTFDNAYNLNNNLIFKQEKEDIFISDEKLKENLKIILQIENNDYEDFIKTFKKMNNYYKPINIENFNWKETCL